jgi:hypothetical protein
MAGLPSSSSAHEALQAAGRELDAAGLGPVRVEVPEIAEMDVFAGGAAEVLPGFAQDARALGRGLLREGGVDVLPRDAVRGGQRAEGARGRGADVRRAVGPERADQAERAADQGGEGFVARRCRVSRMRRTAVPTLTIGRLRRPILSRPRER